MFRPTTPEVPTSSGTGRHETPRSPREAASIEEGGRFDHLHDVADVTVDDTSTRADFKKGHDRPDRWGRSSRLCVAGRKVGESRLTGANCLRTRRRRRIRVAGALISASENSRKQTPPRRWRLEARFADGVVFLEPFLVILLILRRELGLGGGGRGVQRVRHERPREVPLLGRREQHRRAFVEADAPMRDICGMTSASSSEVSTLRSGSSDRPDAMRLISILESLTDAFNRIAPSPPSTTGVSRFCLRPKRTISQRFDRVTWMAGGPSQSTRKRSKGSFSRALRASRSPWAIGCSAGFSWASSRCVTCLEVGGGTRRATRGVEGVLGDIGRGLVHQFAHRGDGKHAAWSSAARASNAAGRSNG